VDDDFPVNLNQCISDFFATEKTRPPGRDIYLDVFKTDVFFPLQRPHELERMIQIARSINPTTVMEIGADKGGGLYHWCKCLGSVEQVIACEIRGIPYYGLFDKQFPGIEFLWLPKSSYDCPKLVKDWLRSSPSGGTIDVLFLDGDKSWFYRDFELYLPFMSRDGIVFVHDITDPAPGEAWENILMRPERFRFERIIDVSDAEAAVSRQQMGIRSTCPHEDWLRHWQTRSCGVGVIHLDGKHLAK
jgi:hypothetical protein